MIIALLAFPLSESMASESMAAERKPLVPMPSVLDFSDGDGWAVGLGAGLEYESAYDGSDEFETEIDPFGSVQYRSGDNLYFWDGFEAGWRGVTSSDLFMQAGIRYESGLEAEDSDDGRLDGIEDRDSHMVGFYEVRKSIGSGWRNWVGGRLMGGDSDFGWLGVIAAGHRFDNSSNGSGTEVLVFTTLGNEEFINKDFGVSAEDAANSALEEIKIDGGYRSSGITLIHRRDLSENWQLFGQAGYELYSDGIQKSDVARNDYEIEIGASLVYVF
jgi:outer membrane scaffolding protein for murein synthesis (MipA/OmpV family)